MFTARSDTKSPYGANAPTGWRFDVQLILIAILGAAPIWLAAGLRPDAFYVGDSGVKLIAARAALAHPSRPLDIALPEIGGVATPHVEPFFQVHGDHAHAVTSPLFPLVSAPLLALFGVRGLYLIPYLSFLAAAAACADIGRTLGIGGRPATVALVTMLGTPFLFYGLEFWEHLPAVACAAMSLALLLRHHSLAAGLLAGIAVLLRPEALAFVAAIAVCAPFLGRQLTWREAAWTGLGAVTLLVPYELYVRQHFGMWIPPHVGANAAAAATEGWVSVRAATLSRWFASVDKASFWRTGPAAIVAIASFAIPRRGATTAALMALGLLTILLTFLTVPNDGGGQWGPRYLLFAQIPLVVVAAGALARLPEGTVRNAVAVVGLAACVWLQRESYRELRGTKAIFGQMVDLVAASAPAQRPIVTDIWWLDQVAAAVVGDRPALFTPDEETGRDVVQRLSQATVPTVAILRPGRPPAPSAWIEGSCYLETRRATSPDGNLIAIELTHRCQP